MFTFVPSLVIAVVVIFSLFFRAHCSWTAKILGSCLVLLFSFKFLVYRILGSYPFAPHLPRAVLLTFEALFGATMVLFFLLLLLDTYRAGNWALAKAGFPVPRSLPLGVIKWMLVGLALLLGVYGTWQAVRVPSVREVVVHIKGLPEALHDFVIVQLSDLHIGPILKREWLEEVVARANALEPDLFALTGDYVDGRVNEMASELAPLASLKAKYGVFGVNGNHEYYWNNMEWDEFLETVGVKMLNNAHHTLNIDGSELVVAGLTDLTGGRLGQVAPDLDAALKDAPNAVRLLLVHQPRNFPQYADRVQLVLSGHTHGGQLFFASPLIAKFNSGFVRGDYGAGAGVLHVSAGTGLWNGFSFRLGVPSEITKIILQPA